MAEQFSCMTLVSSRVLEQRMCRLEKPKPHHVLLRVICAGICGTDLAIFHGQYSIPLPCVLGHEFVGVVEDIGEGVHQRWVGKRVAVEINVCQDYACGEGEHCPTCGATEPNHCEKRSVLGIIHAQGAFAQYIHVPVSNLHVIPTTMDNATAVLVEPMAAALQTFEMCRLQHGQRVVVLGAGRLGALIIAAAHAAGAEVIAVARSESRLNHAHAFGAEHTIQAGAGVNLAEQIRSLCKGQLADVVVEATGHTEGLNQAIQLVRPRGTLCLKTTVGQPSLIDLTRIVVEEIQLSASRCGPFATAIHFLEKYELPLQDWIRASYPLEFLEEAMAEARLPGKVLIDPHATDIITWPLAQHAV